MKLGEFYQQLENYPRGTKTRFKLTLMSECGIKRESTIHRWINGEYTPLKTQRERVSEVVKRTHFKLTGKHLNEGVEPEDLFTVIEKVKEYELY